MKVVHEIDCIDDPQGARARARRCRRRDLEAQPQDVQRQRREPIVPDRSRDRRALVRRNPARRRLRAGDAERGLSRRGGSATSLSNTAPALRCGAYTARARIRRPAWTRRTRRRRASRPGDVAPKSSRVPSARSTQLRPTAPARRRRRRTARRGGDSASITAVIGSRKRTRRIAPSPPRCAPCAAAAARGSRMLSSRTGKRHSSTSGSVRRELVMCVCTTLAPSKSGPAPEPPEIVS